ncbi:hypothetical protein [Flavobacterium psychrotolerans]|uniref:hypothetical protein n=1 Tax=Flavobacterium psychrotolerans TaxID=2169410 RepID=UPI00140DB9E9|nr:hypothetical protein [Flavobacterium psychrotolerans]
MIYLFVHLNVVLINYLSLSIYVKNIGYDNSIVSYTSEKYQFDNGKSKPTTGGL